MAETSLPVVELVVRTIAATAVNNEARFSELDSVAGDGDFGYSLARGFEKVLEEFDGLDRSSAGAFLKRVGAIVTSRCGGTSGPLWGTAFLRAGGVAGERLALEPQDAVAMLRAAFEGIQKRGGAALGDKTLLDALGPMTDRLETELRASPDQPAAAFARAAETAQTAAAATADLVARRGRAAYVGERSRGAPDAGAMAIAEIAREVSVALASADAQGGSK
jgi:dihydroxyacetone kinase/dihydroxyacetone kinase-like protein